MEKWQMCEAECLRYLQTKYSKEGFVFEAEGGSDSTKSDILLKKYGVVAFYIESKMSQAQCGQFVVYQQDNRFVNSERNRHISTFAEDLIIEKMNENFSNYSNPGTAGKDLGLEKNYYYDWILNYYEEKDVKFFIVEKEVGKNNLNDDNFIIFPIQHFYKYFDVTAKYRVKKSGSNPPSRSSISEIEAILQNNRIDYSNLHFEGKKAYINLAGKNQKFQLQGITYDYQFNPEGNNIFEIRKLSNTKNANVIFSISLIKEQEERDIDKFRAVFN